MNPLDPFQWLAVAWLFVLGTCLGSFLNVCIYRIPLRADLWSQLKGLGSPPSTCPKCGNRIPGRDNIPVLGWLKLGGRCRFCRARISFRYPAIELFNGLLLVVLYLCEVPLDFESTWQFTADIARSSVFSPRGPQTLGLMSDPTLMHVRFLLHLALVESLVAATFIDLDCMEIPDATTLPTMLLAVVVSASTGVMYLVPVWFQDPSQLQSLMVLLPEWAGPLLSGPAEPAWIQAYPRLHGLAVSLAGLVVGGGSVWTVRIIGQAILRREAMGFGDVVLMAMIGSVIGWQPVLVVFFLAPATALVVVLGMLVLGRGREFPYGPWLSLATLLLRLGWQSIWPVAEPIFSLGPLVPPLALLTAGMLALCLLLVQGVKLVLGIPLDEMEEMVAEWEPADQLGYQAGENADADQGRWRRPMEERWGGEAAGRGQLTQTRWRYGSTSHPGGGSHTPQHGQRGRSGR